ncbi:DDB1- and CUL4-associated factor 5 [Chelonus insularis]|uniref:DDB1- and CUL4-associated factor 5 n=1 Tax=Chelonus insularis TaxID=460826 RepID=UPI00158AD3C7|nr:DDB1- and CUL4-associated factor 5 [Chelonus insularis]
MARPSIRSPLPCILTRQIDDRINYCKRLVDARLNNSENLYRKDLISHYGCVNAIEFSKEGHLLVSGGDDRRVLLWKVDQALQGVGKPMAMRAQHGSNIFCLGYDSSNTKIFSAGNDDQVIVHDLRTGDPLEYFLHEKPVYGLSVHPEDDNIFSSACDDGRILIFDIRNSSNTEPLCLAQYKTPFHSVMFNPVEPRQLATANAEEGVSTWDIRKPLEPVLRYGLEGPTQSCMNVRFNSAGTRLLALKRRLPPVLYAVDSPKLLCHFDQPGYYNSCTMKSSCFAGDDESYVLSGSDDFSLYMWKIPNEDVNWVESAHMILRGHRSIVNHVRYNPRHCILASSGVEKIIKIWSPFTLGNGCLGGLSRTDGKLEKQRKVFTHDEYIRLVLRNGQFMTHDYSHQSTHEDPRMMAFFDSLVQREIEGWSSEDAPTGQRSPSDSEEFSVTPPIRETDSNDSDCSVDTHMVRTFLGAKYRHPSRGGVVPERPFESPNRITRLIGSCREKLMKLAALEGGAIVNRPTTSTTHEDSDSHDQKSSEEEVTVSSICRLKYKAKMKIMKTRYPGMRNKLRRKCTILKIPSDSESDMECDSRSRNNSKDSRNDISTVDTAQPSTSTGVSSRGSRYSPRAIATDSDLGESNHSSISSDEENDHPAKRRRLKTEERSRGYRNRPERCKSGNKTGREKHHNNSSSSSSSNNSNSPEFANGSSLENSNNVSNKAVLTPIKKNAKAPPTPDSGVTSNVSTIEKCDTAAEAACNGAESSDHERTLKTIECFKKKVDAARKGYRKRSAP